MLTRDQMDFTDAMDATVGPAISKAVRTLIKNNQADPRAVAAALEVAAEKARGWCIGRFGQ